MSVQFGRWNWDGRPVDSEYFEKAKALLLPYGPDDCGSHFNGDFGVLYHALHTTKESRRETQPHITPLGVVITWDGRLDRRAELVCELHNGLNVLSSDVSIVAAAYEKWGTGSFARLVGDWALSVWNPRDRLLILAKDSIGTRHLYYSFDKERVSWGSILEPLVLLAGKTFELEEEYIAGWLSFFPATHLTPYVAIHSVPPSSFVALSPRKHLVSKYWEFDPEKKIRYGTDAEFEEHFRAVFAESVRRRLRSDRPVLAELSGGMDSSSIVCTADQVRREGRAEVSALQTVSYFNDSEPNWDERPFFTRVEEQRGQTGFHIDLDAQESLGLLWDDDRFAAEPGASALQTQASRSLAAHVAACGSRVVLSGIGGDEALGGVPTPAPELADLLVRARWRALARQLKVWALEKRKPWFHLLFDAARGFVPHWLVEPPEHARPASWLNARFAKRQHAALSGYESRLKVFDALPSFQENLSALEMLRRQLTASVPACDPPFEKRYPYLDRDLLAFVYAVPRDQIVRPGQRRSLMRRALRGVVPKEILERKRKAFISRGPWVQMKGNWPEFLASTAQMLSAVLGIVCPEAFVLEVQRASHGGQGHLVRTLRTIALENWLKCLERHGILARDGYGRTREEVRLVRQRAALTTPASSKVQLADDAKRKGRR